MLERDSFKPAVAELKANPTSAMSDGGVIATAFADKGFNPEAMSKLASSGILGPVACSLVVRHPLHPLGRAINELSLDGSFLPSYVGSDQENAIVDASIVRSQEKDSRLRRAARKLGIAAIFDYEGPFLEPYIGDVPTVVIGSGPAGIMQARALAMVGFNTELMTIIDMHGTVGGVWAQPNVRDGVIGNPFPIEFAGIGLSQGPKPGTAIRDFVVTLADGNIFDRPLPAPMPGKVIRIQPGDLHHTVVYRRGTAEHTMTAPLVFNSIGTGRPLPPSNPEFMTTNSERRAGQRWQKLFTPEEAEALRGKRVVIVGLCNSTATILRQLVALNDRGFNIDYTILTRMPEEAVNNPDKDITLPNGESLRVFRNLAEDDLTAYEGDTQNGLVYFQALRQGRIVPDVTHWDRSKHSFSYVRGGRTVQVPCDINMTLIGYAQRPELLENMGLVVTDAYRGTVRHDYDGEVQRRPDIPGRDRLYPGYYLQGAIRRTPRNPNAPVLSSIVHSAFDTTFGAILRAVEYARVLRGS